MKSEPLRYFLRIKTRDGDRFFELCPDAWDRLQESLATDIDLGLNREKSIDAKPEVTPEASLAMVNKHFFGLINSGFLDYEEHVDGRVVDVLVGTIGEADSRLRRLRELLRRRKSVRMRRPFGYHVHLILEFLCSPKTMVIVTQTIADIREEECEALVEGCTRKAQWIRVRGHYTLARALGLHAFIELVAKAFAALKSAS